MNRFMRLFTVPFLTLLTLAGPTARAQLQSVQAVGLAAWPRDHAVGLGALLASCAENTAFSSLPFEFDCAGNDDPREGDLAPGIDDAFLNIAIVIKTARTQMPIDRVLTCVIYLEWSDDHSLPLGAILDSRGNPRERRAYVSRVDRTADFITSMQMWAQSMGFPPSSLKFVVSPMLEDNVNSKGSYEKLADLVRSRMTNRGAAGVKIQRSLAVDFVTDARGATRVKQEHLKRIFRPKNCLLEVHGKPEQVNAILRDGKLKLGKGDWYSNDGASIEEITPDAFDRLRRSLARNKVGTAIWRPAFNGPRGVSRCERTIRPFGRGTAFQPDSYEADQLASFLR